MWYENTQGIDKIHFWWTAVFQQCHITRCTHQKLQTVLATVRLILWVKHLSEEIWISLPSLYFLLLSLNGTWEMIDRSCQGRNRLFSLASVMGFAYGHLRWWSKGRTWAMPCRPFWHWIAMAEYNFPWCYMHLNYKRFMQWCIYLSIFLMTYPLYFSMRKYAVFCECTRLLVH